jgi:hypothetical protein
MVKKSSLGGEGWGRGAFASGASGDEADGVQAQQLAQVRDEGAEREVDGPEILFHGFGQARRRVAS